MTSQTPPSIRPNARDAPTPGSAADDPDEKPPGLSVTQVVASALAAVSSTVLLSYLGVAGTIIGAGVASVLTVVGNNLYTRSILKTRRQMKAALQAGVVLPVGKNGRKVLRPTLASTHSPGEARAVGADDDVRETGQGGAVATAGDDGAGTTVVGHQDLGGTRLDDVHTAATQDPDDATDGTTDATDGSTDASDDEGPASRRPSRRTLILSAVGVFLVLIVGVTLVEVVAGRPLSEILRGEEGSGTSISHVVSRESATTDGTTDDTTDTSTDSPSRGTTPSPAPSETAPVPAPTDPPSTDAVVPDPEPTAPAPAPTPGTGTDTGTGSTGGAGGGTSGSNGSGGTGTGAVPGPGTGNGAEGAPGSGPAGSGTES